MAKVFGANLEFVREDDFVEYFLFPEMPDNLNSEEHLEQLGSHLGAVLKQCNSIVERHISERNHIWHKDAFQLQPRTGSAQERILNDESTTEAAILPPHLHGVTHYGDNIADEWFIVHLLFELTREIPGCIARVIDADGEFMLIEAADALPKWANPDTCEQRVYIAAGGLLLVQNSPSNTAKLISVPAAIIKIRQNPTLYRVSKEIQNCINARLKEFHEPNSSLHRQIVRLPLGVAAILKQRRSLIAHAVRAFCERDPIDLKACRSMRFFPPEQRVRTNVCFTRCLYAMIMHSSYVPERKIGWNLSGATNTEEYKEDLLGVKIACGFEILASQAKDEPGSDENDPAWRAYVRSLSSKGYFRGNLEGSADYKRLMGEAKKYFKVNNERFRTAPLVGSEILTLLRSSVINADQLRDEENNLQPSESDDWLNISADQLDAMLLERYGPKKLYKSNGDINAEEFTKNIAEFLEKQSTFEGIDDDSDDVEDEETTNDTTTTSSSSKRTSDFQAKVKKNHSMRKACNQNPVTVAAPKNSSKGAAEDDDNNGFSTHVRNFLDFVIPEDNWDSNSEMSDYEDEEDLERNFESMTNSEMNLDVDIEAYMKQMDRELAKTTIGQSFETKGAKKKNPTNAPNAVEDDFDDIESFEPININVNTLKNMMDSYKSQIGGAGPVTNLLSAMGVGMSAAVGTDSAEAKRLSESTV